MSSAESTYPIKCVIYGSARSGKTRTLNAMKVLDRNCKARDDVNTMAELRAAEKARVDVITTENSFVMRIAADKGASVMSLTVKDDDDE